MSNAAAVFLWVAVAAACIAAGDCRIGRGPAPQDAAASPLYTNTWAVEVEGGEKVADALAAKYGFTNKGKIGILTDMYEFDLPLDFYHRQSRSTESSYEQMTETLKHEISVKFAQQQTVRKMVKKSYRAPTDPDWPKQWYLSNSEMGVLQEYGDSTLDLNVEPAWIQGITGCNVVVGVVDDGVEYTHPDLSRNYVLGTGLNAITGEEDAFPNEVNGERDSHGTSCAGIIAMEKSNDVCGVGVAYESKITGILLLGQGQTDIAEARALAYEDEIISIYSNSWGPLDDGFWVGGPEALATMTLEQGARQARRGKGSIFVWAAGNGGEYYDSCAADGYVQSIYTIAIGSVGSDSQPASYDERCSAKLASTFVHNPFSRNLSVATTGPFGGCIDYFDGTSAATPVASGTIALILAANPDLTWRDVQYLIVYTSNPDILTVDDLATNGAGLKFSHHFGFGAIDAEATVTRARHWINVPEQQMSTIPVNDTIIVRNISYEQITIPFSGVVGFLEHVVIQISTTFQGVDVQDYLDNNVYDNLYYDLFVDNTLNYIENVMPNRGDIQIELTSPQGTTSILLPYRTLDSWPGEYNQWPFMSVHFWGEDPTGNWTLTVRNRGLSGILEVSDVQFTFYGTTSTPEIISCIPEQCDEACVRGCAAAGPEFCDSCRQLRNATTLECIEECPEGYIERSGYCCNANEAGAAECRKYQGFWSMARHCCLPQLYSLQSKRRPCTCSTTIGAYGGQQGTFFVDVATNACNVEITDIWIRHGSIVDAIQVRYRFSDGRLQTMPRRGGTGGGISHVSIPQGGKIMGLSGGITYLTGDNYGTVITQLRILVLDAEEHLQIYGPFGSGFELLPGTFAVYGDIRSIFGYNGIYLNGLGVFYEPWGLCGSPCAVNCASCAFMT